MCDIMKEKEGKILLKCVKRPDLDIIWDVFEKCHMDYDDWFIWETGMGQNIASSVGSNPSLQISPIL